MIKQRKILLFIHTLNNSGAPLSTFAMGKVLQDNGFYVEIWSWKSGVIREAVDKAGIFVRILDQCELYAGYIKKEIRKFDLIIANTIETYKAVQMYQEVVPTVWVVREGKNLPVYMRNRECCTTLLRTRNLYVISEYVKEYLACRYKKNDVGVLHNFIEDVYNIYKSNKAARQPVEIVYLGTICKRKAQDVLIKAYELLDREYQKQCILCFAGEFDQNERRYCEKFEKKVEKHENIRYLGNITSRDALYKLIAEADVVGQVSRDDACSRVVLEACMLAKPVIVSKNVGAAYMINEACGWIAETNDPVALKEILENVIERSAALQQMGQMARESYLQTSTEEIYKKNLLKLVQLKFRMKPVYPLIHCMDKVISRVRQTYTHSPFWDRAIYRGSRIVLYGAGKVGQEWRRRLGWTRYCKLVLWVDKNYQNMPEEVKSPDTIRSIEYDFILVAVWDEHGFDEVKRFLGSIEIENERVKWCRKV